MVKFMYMVIVAVDSTKYTCNSIHDSWQLTAEQYSATVDCKHASALELSTSH